MVNKFYISSFCKVEDRGGGGCNYTMQSNNKWASGQVVVFGKKKRKKKKEKKSCIGEMEEAREWKSRSKSRVVVHCICMHARTKLQRRPVKFGGRQTLGYSDTRMRGSVQNFRSTASQSQRQRQRTRTLLRTADWSSVLPRT